MESKNDTEKTQLPDPDATTSSNISKSTIPVSTEDKIRPGVLLNDTQEVAEVLGVMVNNCLLAQDFPDLPWPNHHDLSVVELVEDSRHYLEYHYKQMDEEALTIFKLSHVVAPLMFIKTMTPYPPSCKSMDDEQCQYVGFLVNRDFYIEAKLGVHRARTRRRLGAAVQKNIQLLPQRIQTGAETVRP